jgi:hypothetical protein
MLLMKPRLKPQIMLTATEEDESLYQVFIPRTNWLERLSIRYLKQPTHHRIQLDYLGSFVLQHCTGEFLVEQIELLLKKQFGQDAEPTRERLITFLSIVEANDWIEWTSTS